MHVSGSVFHWLVLTLKRTKNSPALISEPGASKASITEGLAQRIAGRDAPASLICRVFSLDMGALMSGAGYKGKYEERVKSVLNEAEKAAQDGSPGAILFIDELRLTMAGCGSEGGGMDAANLVKPLLARGKLRCIRATAAAGCQTCVKTDSALERRLAQVLANEPSVLETTSTPCDIRERHEAHHGVRVLGGSLVAAVMLASRYLTARRLSDSAIDLIDEACARCVFFPASPSGVRDEV